MTENQRRDREISRRDREIMRAELITLEMSEAVRLLGGAGSAKEQNYRASRLTGLSQTVIERLRWRKMKRVPADIADMVREAVDKNNEEGLRRAKHELFLAQQQNAKLAAWLQELAPDQFGTAINSLQHPSAMLGSIADSAECQVPALRRDDHLQD